MIVRAIILSIGLLYASTRALGEYEYVNADNALHENRGVEAFFHIVRANAFFPFVYYTRQGNASIYATGNVPAEVALVAIDNALKHDPYCTQFLWHKVIQELRLGKTEAAKPALDMLRKIDAKSPLTDNAEKVYDAVLEMKKQQKFHVEQNVDLSK